MSGSTLNVLSSIFCPEAWRRGLPLGANAAARRTFPRKNTMYSYSSSSNISISDIRTGAALKDGVEHWTLAYNACLNTLLFCVLSY
jgi:hypothetical protein